MKTTVEIVMNSRMDSGITNNSLAYRLLMKDIFKSNDPEFIFSGLSIMLLSWEGIFLLDNLSSYVHMNGGEVCCSQHHHQKT